ncbi:MAG: ATP-binding cassette domain-containing protein [Brevinematales bacterium]|nr:ATP-binding cassette domain-containing protein [Brevinematales bacterium]
MIEVKNLTKYYGDFLAVNSINFKINKGEIVGLLGPNGAGKSTTIRMLTGFYTPTQGEIYINDISVRDNPIKVKSFIGYIPESSPLYNDMVVYDYLGFVAKIQNVPIDKISERIDFVVEKCGLVEVVYKKIGELSKGYRQRTGLAHAIIHNPQILILDEPTSGLDPNQIIEIRELIKELGKEKTVLLSSHILSEVEATCSRVIIINRGNIVADGDTSELLKGFTDIDRFIIKIKTSDNNDKIQNLLMMNGAKILINEGELKEIIISLPKKENIEEVIYKKIKDTDWILYEFRKEEQSLENLFKELTMEDKNG